MGAARCFAGLLLVLAMPAFADGPSLPDVDRVVVHKADRTLTLYSRGDPVHVVTDIQLGGDPVGPKRFQGDERTPEGRYTIDYGNAESAYHLALHISYPDESDLAHAAARGGSAGGLIFIHGQPNGLRERPAGDWTDGCIAVSNAEIELLWQHVGDGTVIDILP